MSVAWTVFVFAATRVLPALCRVLVAVVVRTFNFLEAHHAAILAALSWLVTQVVSIDSAILPFAKAGLVYFGTSAATAMSGLAMGIEHWDGVRFIAAPIVLVRQVVEDEWNRLAVAFDHFFRPVAPPPQAPAAPGVPENPVNPASVPSPPPAPYL